MPEVGWDVSELANLRRKSLSLWRGKGGSHKRCCQGTKNCGCAVTAVLIQPQGIGFMGRPWNGCASAIKILLLMTQCPERKCKRRTGRWPHSRASLAEDAKGPDWGLLTSVMRPLSKALLPQFLSLEMLFPGSPNTGGNKAICFIRSSVLIQCRHLVQ